MLSVLLTIYFHTKSPTENHLHRFLKSHKEIGLLWTEKGEYNRMPPGTFRYHHQHGIGCKYKPYLEYTKR